MACQKIQAMVLRHPGIRMRLTLEQPEQTNLIRSYSETSVTVNEHTYRHSLVIMPHALIEDWEPGSIDDLQAHHLTRILELRPEMVLLGTGRVQQFPHPRLTYPLMSQGVGVEVMDTQAACRTYNIVMAEGRSVAAALLFG